MIRNTIIFAGLFVASLCLAKFSAGRHPDTANVTVIVHAQPQQVFAGFGTSEMNFESRFQQLSAANKALVSKNIWVDLNFKHLRLWFSPATFLANPAKPSIADFKARYIDSGIVSLAKQQGCTTLLLAPADVPSSFAAPSAITRFDYQTFSDAGVIAYAKLLANFIAQLKAETGVLITATGILNEPNDRPIRFTNAQWPVVIKALRAELDSRGLNTVAIIAPEAASCDDTAYAMVDSLKSDAVAWSSLHGIATHTYNMGATDTMKAKIAGSAKSYWQTESSTPGPENLGDELNAASSAGRFISDLNHGVTHWIWFIGFEQNDPADNGTRLTKFDATRPDAPPDKFYKYFYVQQLSRAFPPGAVARQCTSSTEGSMTWTYGLKPTLLATSAQSADGTISVALVNYTSNKFGGSSLSSWDRSQGGQLGKAINVTLKIEALANVPVKTFNVRRSTDNKPNYDAGTVTAKGGVVTLKLKPLELVTLISR